MDYQKRAKMTAIIVTVLCHVGFFIFILFNAFVTPLPLPGEEGVEVQLGSNDAGFSDDYFVAPALSSQSSTNSTKDDAEDVSTSQSEEDVYIPKKNDNNKQKPKEDVSPVNNKPQQVVNQNALYKGSNSNNTSNSSQGSAGKEGNSGSQFGSANSTNLNGLGGSGSGTSFSLEGRNAVSMPKPEYVSQEEGTIVVEISVNKKGEVINAEPGKKGTTITDQNLWNRARNAAMRTKFSPKPQAAEIQKGTITYNFRRVNE